MDQSDNDLQGTDGSGSLVGADVRRAIKLISKQPIRTKPVRAGSVGYKQEERFECKSGDAYASHRRFPQQMFWDYKLNLIGEKDESPMHFCDKCGLPIKIYGRMIPCKHVFCYECAILHEKKADKLCPGVSLYSCTDAVQRIEQCLRGSLFMCSVVQGCKRTYLSQRDLQAHINHRHLRAAKPAPGRPAAAPSSSSSSSSSAELADRFLLPPPLHLPKPHAYGPPHEDPRPALTPDPSSPPPRSLAQETYRIATVTVRQHSNLITVPIQDDSSGSAPSDPSREPLPQPGHAPPPPPPGRLLRRACGDARPPHDGATATLQAAPAPDYPPLTGLWQRPHGLQPGPAPYNPAPWTHHEPDAPLT
ncbi:hypothetical protein COCON_G00228360 [Conger conger]|uniref:E3 ubiquitin-protein ligase Hakai n=1 Tax=Conger conger TaxID=82655 RepID=A0A9Q1CTS3_CONCO|nr:hypothetical protein COCON_G00228360 [Conger conger]